MWGAPNGKNWYRKLLVSGKKSTSFFLLFFINHLIGFSFSGSVFLTFPNRWECQRCAEIAILSWKSQNWRVRSIYLTISDLRRYCWKAMLSACRKHIVFAAKKACFSCKQGFFGVQIRLLWSANKASSECKQGFFGVKTRLLWSENNITRGEEAVSGAWKTVPEWFLKLQNSNSACQKFLLRSGRF